MRAWVFAAIVTITGAAAARADTPADEPKPAAAAEAPKPPGLLPTTQALPPLHARRTRWRRFELDGYFRVRTDWFKNFNLGFQSDPTLGGAPFPQATSCAATMVLNHPCGDTIQSANMRLRLEPTFWIDEGASVHVQADALDNLVFGSTPINTDYSGIYSNTGSSINRPPLGAFGSTQGNVIRGVNSDRESIQVKRAWAEVALPLDGIIKVGRMPDQWGLGIFHNAGGYDPINGTYNYDADYGDSIDRASISFALPTTQLRAMAAFDWSLERLVSNQTALNKGNEGHPFSLDDPSKAIGGAFVLSKMEPIAEFNAAADRGDTVLDYGVYLQYKSQSFDYDITGFTIGSPLDARDHYVPRNLHLFTPDAWFRLAFGSNFLVEGELVGQFGRVTHLDDLGIQGAANIVKAGGVGRFTWKGVEGKLKLGLEAGFATGDQWDNTPQGNTNIAFANQLGDPTICNSKTCTLTQFFFNRDYFVDLIFWRHLVTAVTNAAYLRPFLQYDLTKSWSFKVWNVTSFALRPVATPGNDILYGTEFDADIGLNLGRLHVGIQGGVFFPFSALSHPADTTDEGGPGFNYGTDPVTMSPNTGDPGTAYTILSRLVLAF